MRYNGVIFDFNGTLLFDDPYHDIAWGKVAREVCGQDVDGHELVSKYSGYPNIEILRDIPEALSRTSSWNTIPSARKLSTARS